MNLSALMRLQNWYLSQCDEDWEHSYGIKIDTLDNPGWTIEIDLTGTVLEARPFNKIMIQREDENDWVHCRLKDNKFFGACGPKNLEEMLTLFLNWTELEP
jgi:Immunity protein 53